MKPAAPVTRITLGNPNTGELEARGGRRSAVGGRSAVRSGVEPQWSPPGAVGGPRLLLRPPHLPVRLIVDVVFRWHGLALWCVARWTRGHLDAVRVSDATEGARYEHATNNQRGRH